MNKSPAFQFYPQDWLSSPRIALMTLAEQGAYIRLLSFDWMNDGIPEKDISRLSGLQEVSDILIECFIAHPKKDGFLTNDRLLKERKKQKDFSTKKKRAGQAGAVKRWGKKGKGDSSAIAHPIAKDSFSSSSSSSTSVNKKPRAKSSKGRVKENTDMMIRIGKWFNRKPETLWQEKEAQVLYQVLPTMDELNEMEAYYSADIPKEEDYRRRNIETLLNNWTGELDRAKGFIKANPEHDRSGWTDEEKEWGIKL